MKGTEMRKLLTLKSSIFILIGTISASTFASSYTVPRDPLPIDITPPSPGNNPTPAAPAGSPLTSHTLSSGDYLNITIQSAEAHNYNLIALEVQENSPLFSGMQVELYSKGDLLTTQTLDWTGNISIFIDSNTPHNLEASSLDFATLEASKLTRIEVHPLLRPENINQATNFSITSLSFGNLTSLSSYVTSANSITYDVQLLSAVPEPSTFLTSMLGLITLAGLRVNNRHIFGRVAT